MTRLIKVTVDLEAETKEDMVRKLQELIWEVKMLDAPRRNTVMQPGLWRKLSELDRAELAEEYVKLREIGASVWAFAQNHDWPKPYAADILQKLRGQGYLLPSLNHMALPELGERSLELLEQRDQAAEQGA